MVDNLQVKGFKAAAVKAGIRGRDRLDLALLVCERPATAAGVFTTNLVKAAPVLLDMERVAKGSARAILVNASIANACTGAEGLAKARQCAELAAAELGCAPEEVLVCSTGVIGEQLDTSCFEKHMASLVQGLRPEGFGEVSRAIMTTDTVPKTAVREVELGGVPVRLVGLAKGAGMIAPNMATMLAFVATDAVIAAGLLQAMLAEAGARSFNRITVDGDTSTNDTLLVLASGLAGNTPLVAGSGEAETFRAALNELVLDLALQIVRDGEGATKLITIRVKGAASEAEARLAAETVAESKLFKTACFGEDANWGRIIAALGRSGANFDQLKVEIAFDGVLMVKDGLGQGKAREAEATKVLKQRQFAVNIDLHQGDGAWEVYTCDLSIDYVKINADYRS
ncbi:MAG: bifunctional glutamate N-acetyltransferase/amino-acid acetyltransferase ArgJ [Desulfobulbaceae bacterium]|nr:bifunctional glutamate N-acetyltransferase/amino-acid acetyltransferase ArgJ [Desulfobulbaceae bacterium]